MIVISDTSAICYLILIDEIEILQKLYQKVLITTVIQRELSHLSSPEMVKRWISNPPPWLEIRTIEDCTDLHLDILDLGEQTAIILAEAEQADLLIIDDALGRKVALSCGLKITGLLGVLQEANRQNIVNLPDVIRRLEKTTFRVSPKLLKFLLEAPLEQ